MRTASDEEGTFKEDRVRKRDVWVRFAAGLLVGAVVATTAGRVEAAGFSIFEQGSRATGMGGAFVAVADDGSAMFYNPAGLAKQSKKFTVMAGMTLIIPDAEMSGLAPYPGPTYSATQEPMVFFPPNLYVSMPLSDCVVLSFGTWFPYGLTTAWKDQDTWAGRYISQRGELRNFTVGLQAAWQIADWIGIGGGPELHISDVKLQQNQPLFNPYTNRVVDVAHVDIQTEGMEYDIGWGAGIMLTPVESLNIGASYHARADADYTGRAFFYQMSTGYADLDALVASRIPVSPNASGAHVPVPVSTTIQYPAITQLGVSYEFAKKFTLSFAANYTEWSAFDKTVLVFQTVDNKPIPTKTIQHDYENAWAFRVGGLLKVSEHFDVELGWVYDQTPQPDKSVGPLLPDANRTGYTVGLSMPLFWGIKADLSYMALFFHDRTTTTNKDNFNGTYKTFAHLIGGNLRASF